ncbi:bacteriocin-type signal sequence-containing protein [Algoriella xinjiangensis]|uniref:Bacteriocin-type signal sequence-containing protein n=1 Tax=Algoriella xinjiangensis TaxID=684065 RepID=A0A1I4U780_9FLAO|nr:hypothetical protein [Algoriella xinjiangensis]SFM84593.1 bacteriocin-type signal sequence-containing protein [Algoriella xinjiangensis]VDH17871.1 Uncharacterised protein [Algoriella xinjiangensis]
MLKNLEKLKGLKKLNSKELKTIKGGGSNDLNCFIYNDTEVCCLKGWGGGDPCSSPLCDVSADTCS